MNANRRGNVRRRETESSGVPVPAYPEQEQQQLEATLTTTTIRLLPLPSWDGVSYPPPLSGSSASTDNLHLRFPPVQQLSSSSSYNDYYGDSNTNNMNDGSYNANANASDAGILWSYSATLVVSLAAWMVFLILPKGLRKAYCRSGRRRYSNYVVQNVNTQVKHHNHNMNNGNDNNVSMETTRHANFSKGSNQHQHQQQQEDQQLRSRGGGVGNIHMSPPPSQESVYSLSSIIASSSVLSDAAAGPVAQPTPAQSFVHNVPSPEHPALARTPDQRILQGTMDRLVGGSGIRLMAHGVQCEPKRVWIRLHMADDSEDDDSTEDDDVNAVPHHEKQQQKQQHSLSWQTEFPRQITDASGRTSIVLFRGTTHTIDLRTVLYVDVGKKTSALLKTDVPAANAANTNNTAADANANVEISTVPANSCFSLLTGNGSLDLQTNSRLERDALVACLSMVLDQVHQTGDWRRLYEESTIVTMASASKLNSNNTPNSNTYQESTAARSLNLSNIGTDLFPANKNTKGNNSKFNDYF
jgi:hypothetical protein